jgi:uncharacterized protein
MFERKSYPYGVPCWVDTIQPDVEAAVAFYSGLFGWECEDQMPPDAGGHYYSAKLHGLEVAAIGGPAAAPKGMWQSYVAVESADDAARRVEKAGGRIVTEPTDAMDAGRYATFADLAGAEFSVWQARRHIGAQLCNEPGTGNFSELNTRDPEQAAQFYGDVFDWEVEDFSMGDSNFTIFKLAGYGKWLMENNPDLTGDLGGAPGGFADAVAMLVRQDDDTAPAHWSVTFAIDDADAVAARAEKLGGKVLVAPFDAEPVRMTVLEDPQGAVFAASKYQPNGPE